MNTYNAAPDFYLLSAAIENLCEKFGFLRKSVIGKSLCGRPIFALAIGSRARPSLYAATFHGSEWLNTLFMLKFAEDICVAFRDKSSVDGVNVYSALQKSGLVIIPCVNPDGVEIQLNGSESCPRYKNLIDRIWDKSENWQANARGVDLNHNFNAGWAELRRRELEAGITSPSPTRYGGKKPFSEPETIALRNLCLKARFRSALAFHSQGRELYCAFKNTPEKSFSLAQSFATLSGYKLGAPEGLAVGGGFKDWLIGYLKTPAITVETGLGKNPLPVSDLEPEYNRIRKALFVCAVAD